MPTLTFRNKHFNPVEIYWLGQSNSNELLYTIMQPGEAYRQGSDAGDTWLIKDRGDNHTLGSVIARADELIEIREEIRRMPVSASTLESVDALQRPESYRQKNFTLYFDSNDVVTVPDANSMACQGDWTLEAWVFRQTKSAVQTVIERYDDRYGNGVTLRIGANNKLQGGVFQDKKLIYVQGETTIEAKRWYHLAISFNQESNIFTSYVNGKADGTALFMERDIQSNRTVLEFDGYNDYLPHRIDVSETAYTLALWFKCNDSNCGIFSVEAGGHGEQGSDRNIYLENGNVCATLGRTNPEVIKSSGKDYTYGWHQVTHVFGGDIGGQRLYVDGKLVATGNDTQSDFSGQTGINLGYAPAAAKPNLNGQLAEVSLWNIARSEQEIKKDWPRQMYPHPYTGYSRPGLQALWRLEEGSGTYYGDATTNRNSINPYANVRFTSVSIGSLYSWGDGPGWLSCGDIERPVNGWTLEFSLQKTSFYTPTSSERYVFSSVWGFDIIIKDMTLIARWSKEGINGPQVSFTLPDGGGFNQCAFTFDVSTYTLKAYFNAQEMDSTACSALIYQQLLTALPHRGEVRIGSPHDQLRLSDPNYETDRCLHFFYIGEISLWDHAREHFQIEEDREQLLLGTEPGLISLWSLDKPDYNGILNNGQVSDACGRHPATVIGDSIRWDSSQSRVCGYPANIPRWNRYSELQLLPATIYSRFTNARMIFGTSFKETNQSFKGMIDCLRIWSVTRSDEQILATWNQKLQSNQTGLAAYYQCDSGAGTVLVDSSANNNHGTIGDNQAQNRPAWMESSLLLMDGLAFDGQNDYVHLSEMEIDYSAGFSIEAWVNYESFQTGSRIIDLGNGTRDNIVLANSGTSPDLVLSVKHGNTLQSLEATNVLKANQWMHIAATIDVQGKAKLYVNGIEKATGSVHLPTNVKRQNNYIGRSNRSSDGHFHGRIDEVRLWKATRTPEQILGYMRRAITPADARLVALYAFDDGNGITAFDSSPNSLHGLLGNGERDCRPTWQEVREAQNVDVGLEFDGQDDYVALPTMTLDFSRGLTLEFRVYFESFNQGARILDLGNGRSSDNITIAGWGTSDDLVIYIYVGEQQHQMRAENILELKRWFHLAIVVDANGNVEVFKNGSSVPGGRGTLAVPNSVERSQNYIGRRSGVSDNFFHGRIDDIRLWQGTRSSLQIEANLSRRLLPESPDLMAYWPAETNWGSKLFDQTTNGYHGILGGGEASHMPQWIEVSPIQFQGFEFDGIGDYLEVDNNQAINLNTDFSITTWIKPNLLEGRRTIISKVQDASECQYALGLEGEMLRFDYETIGNNYALVGGRLQDGWNHVTVTVETYTTQVRQVKRGSDGNLLSTTQTYVAETVNAEGATFRNETPPLRVPEVEIVTHNRPKITLYLNGLRVVSGYAPSETLASNASLVMGAWGTEFKDHFFAGLIDSVTIRSKTLTQAEIQRDMHQRFQYSSSNSEVVGYWKLPPTLNYLDTLHDQSGSLIAATRKYFAKYTPDETYQSQAILDLSANDAVVTLTTPLQLAPKWTLEAYFKTPLPDTGFNILATGQTYPDSSEAAGIAFSNGYLGHFSYGTGSFARCYYEVYATPIRRNVDVNTLSEGWHHLAVVGQDNRMDFYIDATLVGTISRNFSSWGRLQAFGNGLRGGSPCGCIDEVRIWNYARSAEEIRGDRRKSLVGTETGLQGYWRFEEATGTTVNDLTPNRNHGSISGTYSRIAQSQLGLKTGVLEHDPDVDALDFNGSSQYVSMGRVGLLRPLGEPFAIMAWVKSHTDSDGVRVIAGAQGTVQRYGLAQNGSQWQFDYNPAGGGATLLTPNNGDESETWFATDKWFHVAGVYDGDHLKLYVNGKLAASQDVGDVSLSDKNFAIARLANENREHFNGQITEVSVWTRALNAADVDRYMRHTLIGNETGLQGYWNFTEQSGTTVGDQAVNTNHDGVLHNNPTWIEVTKLTLKAPPACLHFNGTDQSVELIGAEDAQLSDDDFTVEAWVKPERLTGIQTILGADDSDGKPGLLLGLKDGKAYMRFSNENDTLGATVLPLNQWSHVVWRYEKRLSKEILFVNGRLEKMETGGTSFYTGTGLLRLGCQNNSFYFQGCLAEIRVWDTLRSNDELTLNMRRRLSGSEKGLLGYWRLDDVSGPYALDSHPLKNHGVLYGNGSRLPLDDLAFNTDAIPKMPTRHERVVVDWAQKLPVPENPDTRSQATGVVPAPSTPKLVTGLTFTSDPVAGTSTTVNTGTASAQAVTTTAVSTSSDATNLPAPFDQLARSLLAAINSDDTLPQGEIKLTSEVLSPFDPFENLFGFRAEFLHIRNARVEKITGGDSGISSGSGFGIRLAGTIIVAGLEIVTIEADFYKNTASELFSGGKNSSGLSYLVNFRFPEPVGLGTLLSDVPIIGGINFYKPAGDADDPSRLLGLIITNDENENLSLLPGLNAYGTVRVATSDDPVFKFIGELLGIQEIQLHVAVVPQQLNLDAVIKQDVELIKDTLWFKDTGISLQLKTTPPEISVSMFVTFEARVEKQTLKFIGAMGITTGKEVAFNGSLTMQGDWRKPFGLPGLVISDLAAAIAGKPEAPWIDRLGYTGKIAVGKAYIHLAGMVDTNDPDKFVYVAEGANLEIVDIVNTLCGPDTVPEDLADVLGEIKLHQYKLSIVPGVCYIGQIAFTETGITFQLAVTLFGWNADFYMRVDYADGITAWATLDPLNFCNGLIEIRESRDESGQARTRLFHCPDHVHNIQAKNEPCQVVTQYACPTHPYQTSDYAEYCPACDDDSAIILAKKMEPSVICHRPLQTKRGPQAYLRLSPYEASELYISGYASFLGISVDTYLSISSAGFDGQFKGNIWGLFKVELILQVAPDFSDVYVKVEMRNDFFARIREEAVAAIRKAADAAVNEISGAQEKVKDAQKEVDKLLDEIEHTRAVIRGEREAASRAFRAAQRKVDAASREVDHILDEIESTKRWYNSLPGADVPWKPSKARDWIWVGPKLAGLYIAYGVAKGALWLAKKVLQGMDWLVQNIPIDMDPRIVALFTAYGVATAALKIAEGLLEGTKYIVQGAAYVAEQITRLALGELFDIRYAKFEGRFSSAITRVDIEAHIVFLKQNLIIHFWFDKDDIAGSIGSLVTGLIDGHTPAQA